MLCCALCLDAACSNLRTMSPSFCGNSPYPRSSLTYRLSSCTGIIPRPSPFVKPFGKKIFPFVRGAPSTFPLSAEAKRLSFGRGIRELAQKNASCGIWQDAFRSERRHLVGVGFPKFCLFRTAFSGDSSGPRKRFLRLPCGKRGSIEESDERVRARCARCPCAASGGRTPPFCR